MLSARRSRSPRDHGFTLIELVISVALLGIVMSAISAAMLVALRTDRESEDRLGDSADVQFASTWFGDDVAGANDVIVGGTAECGSDTAVVVQFLNRDQPAPTARPTPAPTPTPQPSVALRITYALRAASEGDFRELHRLACAGDGSLRSDDIVARRLSPTAPVPVPTVAPGDAAVAVVFVPATVGADPFTLYGTRRSS